MDAVSNFFGAIWSILTSREVYYAIIALNVYWLLWNVIHVIRHEVDAVTRPDPAAATFFPGPSPRKQRRENARREMKYQFFFTALLIGFWIF